MKKALPIILVVLAAVLGGFFFYTKTYLNGDDYYVKITTDGKHIEQKYKDGSTGANYVYDLTGYDEDGQSKELEFKSNLGRPLRRNAYLKVTYSKNKDSVTQWEEVSEKDIPSKAVSHLDSGKS